MIYWIFTFLIISPFASQTIYSEEFSKHKNIDFSCDEINDDECCINIEDLRLISGRIFLSYDNLLIPLKSVRYDLQGAFVKPEAIIPVPCSECGYWYILGYSHDCNGVLK